MREFHGIEDLRSAKGEQLGVSGWYTISQEQIDRFADATGDHQWIHVDQARAKAGPFGTTIAHGFLTLSLVPELAGEVYRVTHLGMVLNYGLNKVRFTAPVPVGSRIRGAVELTDVRDVDGGVQLVSTTTVELEGAAKPVLVAEWITRLLI